MNQNNFYDSHFRCRESSLTMYCVPPPDRWMMSNKTSLAYISYCMSQPGPKNIPKIQPGPLPARDFFGYFLVVFSSNNNHRSCQNSFQTKLIIQSENQKNMTNIFFKSIHYDTIPQQQSSIQSNHFIDIDTTRDTRHPWTT